MVTEHLIETLAKLGFDVAFVDRRFSSTVDQVGRFQLRKIAKATGMWWRLWKSLGRRTSPSALILFTTVRKPTFLCDVVNVWIANRRRVPIIHYVHSLGFAKLAASGRGWAALVRYVLAAGTETVVLGDRLVDDVKAAGSRAITVIPNTVEAPLDRVASDDGEYILFYSNLHPDKGAEAFVRMAKLALEEHPETRFVVAGRDFNGELSRLQGIADDERIEFVGAIGPADKWPLLARARALVFPSIHEMQPLAIIEAMSVGVPVVAYDVGGVGDLVHDGINGSLVAKGDITGLLAAVTRMITDGAGRTRAGAEAARIFREMHSPTQFAARWSALLARTVSDGSAMSRRS